MNPIEISNRPPRKSLLASTRDWITGHPGKSGALAGWYQQGCGVLAQMISYPLLIKNLTHIEAGIWLSFQGLLAALNLADFGLSFAISRQVAYSLHEQDPDSRTGTDFVKTRPGWDGVAEVFIASTRLFNFASGIAFIAMLLLYGIISCFGKLAGQVSVASFVAWLLLGCGAIFALKAKPAWAIIDGCGKVYLTRSVVGTCQLLSGLGVLVALALRAGMGVMAFAVFGVQILQWLVLHRLAWNTGDSRRSKKIDPTPGLARNLFRVAVPIGLMNLSAFFVSSIQVPLLGTVLGAAIVPPFWLAQRIGQSLLGSIGQVIAPQVPLFTRDLASGMRQHAAARYKRGIVLGTALSVAALLFFFFASPVIVRLWIGHHQYVDTTTLALMTVDYLLLIVGVNLAQFVLAAGRNPFVYTTGLSAVLNVLLIFVLCPRLGLPGIPLSSLTAGLVTNYWYTIYHGIRLSRQLRHVDNPHNEDPFRARPRST